MRLTVRGRATVAVLAVVVAVLPAAPRPPLDAFSESIGTEDDPNAQAAMEFLMLRDPVANTIPHDIHRREAVFARSLPRHGSAARTDLDRATRVQTLTWTARGPNNV